MKYGMRKPSLKKSISARTTGKIKRDIKKSVIPGYGKKGTGYIKDPKKAIYNKIYNQTTFGVSDIIPPTQYDTENTNQPISTPKKPKLQTSEKVLLCIGYTLLFIAFIWFFVHAGKL